MLNCPNCGAENTDDYQVCVACGMSREIPKEKRSNKKLLLFGGIVGLFLLVVCIIVAGLLWFNIIGLPSGGNQMLVAFPNRDGETDLMLLKPGQDPKKATLLAEDVFEGRVYIYQQEASRYMPIGSRYGGFVPGTNRLLFWYADKKQATFINQSDTRGKDPVTIFDTKTNFVGGLSMDQGRTLLFRESGDGQDRCYLSVSGKEAERLAKGEYCWVTGDGSNLVSTQKGKNDYTMTLINLKNLKENVVLDDEEDVTSAIASYDGSRVAYLYSGAKAQIILLDGRTGKILAEGKKLPKIQSYSFIGKGSTLYYLGLNDDGEEELYFLNEKDSSRLASGEKIKIASIWDGKYLIYLVSDEDGEETLATYSFATGQETRLEQGDDLEFVVTESPERVLILSQDRDEVTLISTAIKGDNLTQLYSDDDLTFSGILQVYDHPNLFVFLRDSDGLLSLYITPFTREGGYFLLEEWAEIRLHNISPDGSTLLFSGREDKNDDLALYAIPMKAAAEPVELDDDLDVGILNAVFTGNGKEVIYTATTGQGADDMEVRQVRADGKEAAQRLYKRAFLVDIQWGQLSPFRPVFFQKP